MEQTILPYFTATNALGVTDIPSEALGAPLRLSLASDGSVKFSKAGRPVMRTAKEISDEVRIMRERFEAGLQQFANGVAIENPDAYQAEVEAAKVAGKPILENIQTKVEEALRLVTAKEAEQAEAAKAKKTKKTKEERVAVPA